MAETVGLIGLGGMGSAIAANLLRAGFGLRVYNRTRAKAEPLARQGAQVRDSPAETAEPGGIVITIVSNDDALLEVTTGRGGILDQLGPGGIHLSMSTISVRLARDLTGRHHDRGSHYVASPVFGKPEVAAQRKLWVCSAGDPAARARVRPLQEAIGQRLFDLGDDPPAAHAVKLAGNFLIAAAIEAMAEAFTLTQKHGVARTMAYELFTRSLFDCFVYREYGQLVATEKYEPVGAKPSLIRKDLGLVLDAAREALVAMPFAHIIHDHMTATVAKGRDDTDWAGFAREVSESAGL
jgi:3-hydroxyisobutyrate dehydrogenase-like beta-hydroxyacid dehydrogenase